MFLVGSCVHCSSGCECYPSQPQCIAPTPKLQWAVKSLPKTQPGHRSWGASEGPVFQTEPSTQVPLGWNLGSPLCSEYHPSLNHHSNRQPWCEADVLCTNKSYLAAPGWWSNRGTQWSRSSRGHMCATGPGSWTPPSPGCCTGPGCSTDPCMSMQWFLLLLRLIPRSPWTGIWWQTWCWLLARQVLSARKPPQAGSGAGSQGRRDF